MSVKWDQSRLWSGVASWRWQGFEKRACYGWVEKRREGFPGEGLKVLMDDNKGDDVWGVCLEGG